MYCEDSYYEQSERKELLQEDVMDTYGGAAGRNIRSGTGRGGSR